jgi:hypothetical protein
MIEMGMPAHIVMLGKAMIVLPGLELVSLHQN